MRRFGVLLFLISLGARAEIYGPIGPTPLVSGNGFGFATYSLEKKGITKFYAHPYRFERPDPSDEFGEGIETTNLLSGLSWESGEKAAYVNQSHVIEVSGGSAPQFYFMPFGLARNALVTGGASPCLRVSWVQPPRRQRKLAGGILLSFAGQKEKVLALPIGGSGNYGRGCFSGARGWALLPLEKAENVAAVVSEFRAWAGADGVPELAAREVEEMERWRVSPRARFQSPEEQRLWRQSEVILRMAQSREPNRADRFNNGLIVASLPEGMWFVSWVRDMAYATLALIRMGHEAEARAALRAYFAARPVGKMRKEVRGYPYQISVVRYFGNGTEEPFFTMEGSPNIEFDGWGLVLILLGEYVDKFGDLSFLDEQTGQGPVYAVARDLIAKPLVGNMDRFGSGKIMSADTSIWEEAQPDKKHFVFSSATALAGMKAFSKLAARKGDERASAWALRQAAYLESGIREAFTGEGFLVGTQERNAKNLVDSAALEVFNLGVLNEPALMRETIAKASALRVGSGGYRRVRGETPYEKHEFLFSNFSLARNFLRLGDGKSGEDLIRKMLRTCAADNYFVPEMVVSEPDPYFPGEIGTPTGSIPMVGYGAGIFITYLLEREDFNPSPGVHSHLAPAPKAGKNP